VQKTKLAPETALIIKPRTHPDDPDQRLVRVQIPDISYEKGKEFEILEDFTPVQPCHHPYHERPWLSLRMTNIFQLQESELLAKELEGFKCPSSKRSLRKQKVFYESVFPPASKGKIHFVNELNLFGSFQDAIVDLRMPSEVQICQSLEWKPFFNAAVRLDRIGVQFRIEHAWFAERRLHGYAKCLNKAFRDFVVLWGSTVYIESIAQSKLWGGTKDK
jgi:hypothetical protein